MAELELWYFVEGTDKHNYVVISEDAKVGQLRKAIYENERKTNLKDVGSSDIVLLRVDIDAERHNYVFHDLHVPDNATTLPPMTKLQKWWPEELTECHLRVCVRLPSEPAWKRLRRHDGLG